MRLGLGNTLVGNGPSNPDGLSLDLQFAADKSLTARKGPTPTFTRSSNSTYYGPLIAIGGNPLATTGVLNGRALWFNTDGGGDSTTLYYNINRWQVDIIFEGVSSSYQAAVGSEFRPDSANWTNVPNYATPKTSEVAYGIVIAAEDEPRFDHNPATNLCKGLLIEESRTNLAAYSNQFDDASWVKTNSTITPNAVIAPDGTWTGYKLKVNTSSGQHNVVRSAIGASGSTVTISVFARAAGLSTGWLALTDNVAYGAYFDLINGVTGSNIGAITSKSITSFGSGWYRCTVSAPISASSGFAAIVTNADNVLIFTGANTTDGIYIWGAQVEVGSCPTSYMPTTTGSAIRSADLCSITGSAFTGIWSGVDATMFFRGSRIANQSGQTNWSLLYGTNAPISSDRGFSTERIVANYIGIMTDSAFTTLAEYKIATALKTGDYATSWNGASVVTSSSAFVLTLDRMTIGMTSSNNGQLNGWIHSIGFYKKRLTNGKLVTLSV